MNVDGIYKPIRMQLKPQFALCMQFLGWSNADAIYKWCGKVFYVARGHEHTLRKDNEFDRSNGHILDTAPPYLALETSDEGWVRVDIGEWIILGGTNMQDLNKMTEAEYNQFYTEPTE